MLQPRERTEADWQAIRDIFTRNLLFNEERGRAATGLAVVQRDGQVRLLKEPRPASQFIETEAYRALLQTISAQTTLVLGHTRLPTKGDPACDENNHPIQAGPVFGVHNGQITNDDALFARLRYARCGEVDSEIIFRLLAEVCPDADGGSYLGHIRPQVALLEGQFTFLACDSRSPGRLIVLKHNNPLCVHYHVGWEALIFSSRYIFLRKAFGQSVLAEALEHDRLMCFNADDIAHSQGRPEAWVELFAAAQ